MTSLLTPQGITQLPIGQKYTIDSILDLDDSVIDQFIALLKLPGGKLKRYQVIYSLSINNLLEPDLADQLSGLSLTATQSGPTNLSTIFFLDSLLQTGTGDSFATPYGFTIAGKRSHVHSFLKSLQLPERHWPEFEASFHLLPNKFIGSSDRISNPFELRQQITARLTPVFVLSELIMRQTFDLIDATYFSGLLKYRLQAARKTLSMRVSGKMIRAAGKMTTRKHEYEITIAERINEVIGQKVNSGVLINGPVDAFVVTMQHEIVHLIVHLEMDRLNLTYDKAPDTFKSHGTVFQSIAERFFGLTERTHAMFDSFDSTGAAAVAPEDVVSKSQLHVGMTIKFMYKGVEQPAVITKLNPKNAQVRSSVGNFNVRYAGIRI